MAKIFRRLVGCSAGAVAVITAMVLPLLLGFSSMGVEVGHWYLTQRQMQGAADAAAISAAAQYVRDQVAGNGSSTAYQTVGQTYASLNGFTIPTANVCLVTVGGQNCDTVESLDPQRGVVTCQAPPCIAVEITQNTLTWLTTQRSLQPTATGAIGQVQPITTPILKARAVVSVVLQTGSAPTGNSCILTLANDRNAIQVRGNGDIHANCGLLIDGGRDQNARTPTIDSTPLCSDGSTPPCGGLTLSGSNAAVHITNLTIAASTPGPAGSSCQTTLPQDPRCFLYNPATTALPPSAIFTNVDTADPFAGRIFTKPSGVVLTGITTSGGTGYTNGTGMTFTVGGTDSAGIPAKFTATVSDGTINSGSIVIIDPGQYTTVPSPATVTPSVGAGSGTTVTLTTGNCFPGALVSALPVSTPPLPNRAYCSIPATKSWNFASGIYYIEGGDAACIGFCVTTGNTSITNAAGGVTFVLTNVTGGASYARLTVSGNNAVNLTAPASNINADGTTCPSGCANTTFGMIIFQDRNAPITTSLASNGTVTPATTLNTLAGCGNNPDCRTLSGALYLPNQTLNFSGNGTVHGSCFGLVSKYLDDAGTPTFQNGCLPGTTGGGGGSGSIIGGTFKLAQ